MTDNKSEDEAGKPLGPHQNGRGGQQPPDTDPSDSDSDDDAVDLMEGLPHYFTTILSAGSAKTVTLPEQIDRALSGVLTLKSKIRADGRTTPYLGSERAGSGLLIDRTGLILTIGYLIMEAEDIVVADDVGNEVHADLVGYDHDTGFGLVRAGGALQAYALPIGDSADLQVKDPVLAAGGGGRTDTIAAFIVSRRPFAGYWEYMLDDALFTSPPHQNWGGAALLNLAGELVGVGSLLLEEAGTARSGDKPQTLPGNMFVPIDLIKPILTTLVRTGGSGRPTRPWLGLFTAEAMGRVVVAHTADDGPAAAAGIKSEDQIIKVNGKFVDSLERFYQHLWSTGPAGSDVQLTILRNNVAFDLPVKSVNRLDYLRMDIGS